MLAVKRRWVMAIAAGAALVLSLVGMAVGPAAAQASPTVATGLWGSVGTNVPQGQKLTEVNFSAVFVSTGGVSNPSIQELVPLEGEKVYFSVEDEDGIWFDSCSAVTNNKGVASCSANAPITLADGTSEPVSAWSAVTDPTLAGDNPSYAASNDYGTFPGAPTAAPTPPDNGGITIVENTVRPGCTMPVAPGNGYPTFASLLTDGGNCEIQPIEAALAGVAVIIGGVITGGQTIAFYGYALSELTGSIIAGVTAGIGAAVEASELTRPTFLAQLGDVSNPPTNDIIVALGVPLAVAYGTTFTNSGTLTNSGTITGGDVQGFGTGTIVNDGTIINDGTIVGDGQGTDGGVLITNHNYTLNFNDNGGLGATPTPLHVYAATVTDSEQSLPAVQAPVGKGFTGWSTSATGGTPVTNTTDLSMILPTGPSATTLYAQFYTLPAASSPTITNLPSTPTVGSSFVAQVSTNGDGTVSVTSSTPATCQVASTGEPVVSFLAVGPCDLTASVTDGVQYSAATGPTAILTVSKPVPGVSSQLSTGETRPGVPVSDTVTVLGNYTSGTPTGDLQFYLCGPLPSASGCSSTTDGAPIPLSGSTDASRATSPTVTPTQDGIYCFGVSYPGDGNYLSSGDTGSDGCFTVGLDSTVTALSCPSGTVAVGAAGSCSSTVTDNSGSSVTPTGTVTYSVYTGAYCQDDSGLTLVSSSVADLAPDGSVPDYSLSTGLAAGIYNVMAQYGGDTLHDTSSGCVRLLVGGLTPYVTAELPGAAPGWITGAQAYDRFSVTDQYPGGSVPLPGGSVKVTLYGGSGCSGAPISTGTYDYGSGVTQSDPSSPLAAGSYSFAVAYLGDGVYTPATIPCQPFTVGVAQTSLASGVVSGAGSIGGEPHYTVGQPLLDKAELTGLYGDAELTSAESSAAPSGTVTYSLYDDPDCNEGGNLPISTQSATLNADASIPLVAINETLAPGGYSYSAAYSGDDNYGASDSTCNLFFVDPGSVAPVLTVADAATGQAWDGTETAGASAQASVSIGTFAAFTPTGQVTYTLYDASTSC